MSGAIISNTNTAKAPNFIHLRVHSAYSLLASTLKISQLSDYAIREQMPAIAITDHNNLFGIFEFAQKLAGAGVQPIIGCEVTLDGTSFIADNYSNANDFKKPIVLLAQDEIGYKNLLFLVSHLYLDRIEQPTASLALSPQILAENSSGIIVLTGGDNSLFNHFLSLNNTQPIEHYIAFLQKHFANRTYVELQRHGDYNLEIESKAIELAYKHAIPLVATNSSYFLNKSDFVAHDALLAIADGELLENTNRRRVTEDHYLKPAAEMCSLFADIPEALNNTVEIAKRCAIYPKAIAPLLPRFITAADKNSDLLELEAAELIKQAKEGLSIQLQKNGLAQGYTEDDYIKRLDYELSIIIKMQFPGYFLIVADFIKWAKAKNIPVGPGRGSGAGSLVAYALTICGVDPLRFSLLFERFLNPDRVSMPDFDIDFCQTRRNEVISYVQQRYGADRVAQIITFGSLQAKGVLRDVGRVLQMPYSQVDRLSKLIPNNPANPISLKEAIESEAGFAQAREEDPKVEQLLEIAQKLEGLYRHASTHAAGLVIGDRPLAQLVPLYSDTKSEMPVTQFNMKFIEQAGLVKFDFLGLKTLTVIQATIDLVKKRGIQLDIDRIDLSDQLTYQMLSRGETVAVFQLESAGMRKAIMGMKPDCIEDLVALVALYRPGPMENIPTYNNRKNGHEQVESMHPKIDKFLQETYGVIIYQEQVMQIAQELSGYSLGEADLLRRAMGKKIAKEMEVQRSRFVKGAIENAVDEVAANQIFDLLAKFANYGFNKSHAVAYGYLAYQTAYLKAHYAAEFLAASMSYDLDNLDKLNEFRLDAARIGIEVVPPSVQTSFVYFEVSQQKILYALAAIKGVGELAAKHIVELRNNGKFKDIEDFCQRVDLRIVNKRALESLIAAGALDCFKIPRHQLYSSIEHIQAFSTRAQEQQKTGQKSLFQLDGLVQEKLTLLEVEPWGLGQKLQKEFDTVGFYLSEHPLDTYKEILARNNIASVKSVIEDAGKYRAKIAGTLLLKTERRNKKGNKFARLLFSDQSKQFETVLFSDKLEHYRPILEIGKSFLIDLEINRDKDDSIDLRIISLSSLEECTYKEVHIYMKNPLYPVEIKAYLSKIEPGKTNIYLHLYKVLSLDDGSREIIIELANPYNVSISDIEKLKNLASIDNIIIN